VRERERDTHTHTAKRRREKQINKTSTQQQLFSLLLILLTPPTPSQNSCWIHTMFLQDSRISPRIPPLGCLIHRSCCWLAGWLVGCHPRTHHPNERERKNRRVETLHPTKINPKLQRQEKEEENKMCRETKETPNDRRRSKSFVYLIYKYREREREREIF
jgi:hypothetical protein